MTFGILQRLLEGSLVGCRDGNPMRADEQGMRQVNEGWRGREKRKERRKEGGAPKRCWTPFRLHPTHRDRVRVREWVVGVCA